MKASIYRPDNNRKPVAVTVECTLTPDCDAWWLGALEPKTRERLGGMDKTPIEYKGRPRGRKRRDASL